MEAAEPREWPTRWNVNGNGATGHLEFSIRDDGSLEGRLLGQSIEGYVSGRHLFMRRVIDDRTEVWEGWLGRPGPRRSPDGEASSNLIAGTISVDEAGRTLVYPWFATPDSGSPTSSPAESPIIVAPAPTAAAGSEKPDGGPLSGFWSAAEGRVEIIQDGNRLTVILPDAAERSGRMTGVDTLVVGLRKGCCNGNLDGPDVIIWSDGARWRRTD
jgi:hypothetical protein